ncbi:MAG: hypothetical protein JJ974_10080 [Phycisphaerales bacterium]|nr:hypothetical protein [Phycisphaerales bacterium]
MNITATAATLAVLATTAAAAPTTWIIDQEWEFYTSNTPAQTRLVGSITFDRAVSDYYPSSWSFTLVHFDPAIADNYPITIEGSFPNLSDASGVAWAFRRDILTQLNISFGSDTAISDVLLDGTQESVSFSANEYVQVGPVASQRIINNGTANLFIPSPASTSLLALTTIAATRRRR